MESADSGIERQDVPSPPPGRSWRDEGHFWVACPVSSSLFLSLPKRFSNLPWTFFARFPRSGESAASREPCVACATQAPSGHVPRRSSTCDLAPPARVPGSVSPSTRGSRHLAAGISGCDSELHSRGPRSSRIFQGQSTGRQSQKWLLPSASFRRIWAPESGAGSGRGPPLSCHVIVHTRGAGADPMCPSQL